MRNPWAVCAFFCALIAIVPADLAAQSTTSSSPQATTPADILAKWEPYSRLVGLTMKDRDPSGFALRWRWEIEGEVLLEEWFGSTDFSKPSHVMTIRLGPQPGAFNLKSSAMMGKEWLGTVQADGSVNYVGKGLLKMRYSIRVDEHGNYEQADTRGNTYLYVAITPSTSPVVVADGPAPAVSAPADSPAPRANSTPELAPASPPPVPVAANSRQNLPPAPPVKTPRKLSDADLAAIRESVQVSRARSAEQARRAEIQRQEAARQAALQAQLWAAQEAQRQAEEAAADAEFEEERARKAAAWQQSARASEQALSDSMQRLRDTTAQVQAQQAEAAQRQRLQAEAADRAERARQVELIRQANQRQEYEAARLAAQREQATSARQHAETLSRQRSTTEMASAGRASTDTDANRCVTRAEVRQNDTFQGNTAAYVVNGCGGPVDVKVCLNTETGWKCGATWALAPQARWSYSAFRAIGPVFVDAKSAGSSRALGSPQ